MCRECTSLWPVCSPPRRMRGTLPALFVTVLGMSCVVQHGLGEAPPRGVFTCSMMNSTDVYDMSYQGSWTYRELSRTKAFDTGDIFMATFSDTGGGAMFPAPLSLTPVLGAHGAEASSQQQEPPCSSLKGPFCDCKPGNCSCASCGSCINCNTCVKCAGQPSPPPPGACEVEDYLWRPDFVTQRGSCGANKVSMELAYLDNATFCARYNLTSSSSSGSTFKFGGAAPTDSTMRKVTGVRAVGNGVIVDMQAFAHYGVPFHSNRTYPRTNFDRRWVFRTNLPTTATINGMEYSWLVGLQAGSTTEVTVCVTEMEDDVPNPLPSCPMYNVTSTTANIDDWFAELNVPAGISHPEGLYNSWYQFWYNTEHDAGNWVAPVITPSISTYGRGMWLWDSAFHVMSLVSGGRGPRSLKLAGDQLRVLIRAGNRIGHIPRVVGSVGLEETTQPPGILTWASLVYFNRTQDTDFLAEAYAAYSANNRWYYTEPGYATSTGLSTWCCEDTGWDTSPRWDNGTVEAIDLNGWLHIDQLLLAHMGEILKKPSAEVTAWKVKAKQTAAAVTARLWDPAAGVFWDRLPNKSADHATISNTITNTRSDSVFVKVVTPATFWSLFSAIATPKQAESQVATFLVPDKLATPFPMPCVGVNEPQFQATNYWRGPTWINVNWLVALGFDCYGLTTQAKHIREKSIEMVGMSPYPREYYNALTGGGLGAENYMWTGAIDIILANELVGRRGVADVLHSVLSCPASLH